MFHVEQNNNILISRNCPLCGSDKYSVFIKSADYFLTMEKFTVVKCDLCNFIFTNPVPDKENLSYYYESKEYLSHQTNNKSLIGRIYTTVKRINIQKKYKLIQQYRSSGSVLEIGTGTGELLYYFKKRGWKTTGIEPNEKARLFANKQYELEVFDEIQLDSYSLKSFDVIMMWHVLEHIFDLQDRMKQIKKLLKENGYLFIAVPNINSYDFSKYGSHWAGLDLPRHLYHFNENSIKKLLQKHALKYITSYPMKFDAYYVSLLSERYLDSLLPYLSAFKNGYRSNHYAKHNNEYSSMIFVATEY